MYSGCGHAYSLVPRPSQFLFFGLYSIYNTRKWKNREGLGMRLGHACSVVSCIKLYCWDGYLRCLGHLGTIQSWYFCLSSLPSCFFPINSTALITAAQVGGGSICCSHISSISKRQLCGSRRQFTSMLLRLPCDIPNWTPNIFHLSATWL